MGTYLNPKNDLFKMSINSEIYVDKTMLIDITNGFLNTDDRHICISRPRRFGKSMAANMLAAYYSRRCDSRELFNGFEISKADSFEKHLNKYNVICFSVKDFTDMTNDISECIELLANTLLTELIREYPDIDYLNKSKLPMVLMDIYNASQIPFVFIIDEWDCVFRIFKSDKEQQGKYLSFLRSLLKDKAYVALDYATGIFPVKKYGEHSALNMYREYSINDAAPFSEFTGFTENEVHSLCRRYDLSFDEMKEWYNGYNIDGIAIYNPQSVVNACMRKRFSNYWTKTETFEALRIFIRLDMDGLRQSVIRMIAGERVPVNTDKFQNDMVTFNSADDIITLLIHLGYLTYDRDTKTAWIPNKEVQQEFINSIEDGGWEEVVNSIKQSDELLNATLSGDSERAAEILEEVHEKNTSIIGYNNEMSLSVTLALAYYSARNKYEIFRELPSGKGFADLTFIPRRGVDSPAMVIELKYNKAASKALEQIKEKNYTEKLKAFSGEILLVGISYDESKGHSCVIEKIVK